MDNFLTNAEEFGGNRANVELLADSRLAIMASGSPAPLDADVIANLERLQGVYQFSFLSKLIELYLRDAPQHLAALRSALHQSDANGAQQAAHALKSGSYQLGALPLAQGCEALERGAELNQLGRCGEIFEQLEREFDRVQKALGARLKAGSA